MKLKYYLRGIGIGVILAAVVMGIALGGRGRSLSDAEIMERAKKLGMVEAEGTLSDLAMSSAIEEPEDGTDGEAGEAAGTPDGQEAGEGLSVSPLVPESDEEPGTEEEQDGGEGHGDLEESSDESGDGSGIAAEEATQDSGADGNAAGESETAARTEIIPRDDGTVQATSQTVTSSETAQSKAPEEAQPTTGSLSISIPKGVGSDTVASMLERAGLVDSATAFNQYLIQHGKDRIIRSGNKTIPSGADYEQIARIITQ